MADKSLTVEITQEAQISLGFASPHSAVELEKRQFTKAEILRLRAGRPLHGPGSRGGRMGGERVFRDRRTSVRKEIQGGIVFIPGGVVGLGAVGSQADDGNDQEDEGDGDEEEEREGGDDESAGLDEPGL